MRLALLLLALGLLACEPSLPLSNPCDPANNQLDLCNQDAGIDAEAFDPGRTCADRIADLQTPTDDWVCLEPGAVTLESETAPVLTARITTHLLFYKTEVTRAQWQEVMGATPLNEGCENTDCVSGDCPITGISWNQAALFANRLTRRDARSRDEVNLQICYEFLPDESCAENDTCSQVRLGPHGLRCTGYRLPTEAEWAFYLDAGLQGIMTESLEQLARFDLPELAAVASVSADANQISDLLGNAAEWVHDTYDDRFGGDDGQMTIDPMGMTTGGDHEDELKVVRGGSVIDAPASFAEASRLRRGAPAYGCEPNVSFRPVRYLP